MDERDENEGGDIAFFSIIFFGILIIAVTSGFRNSGAEIFCSIVLGGFGVAGAYTAITRETTVNDAPVKGTPALMLGLALSVFSLIGLLIIWIL